MECSTPDKPEVLAITSAMGWDDPDITVGKLFRLWCWFDQQTTDGNAARVTSALLDRVVGVTGFVQAVADVGWLTINEDGISLNNFDRHNGETAKQRALTAKRVAEHKANAKGNGDSVSEALPRGRGRGRSNTTPPDGGVVAPRATRKCPESFAITSDLKEWAAEKHPRVDLVNETAKMRDHTFKIAISDWAGAWRNWIRNAETFAGASSKAGKPTKHAGFETMDYSAGVNADGTLA